METFCLSVKDGKYFQPDEKKKYFVKYGGRKPLMKPSKLISVMFTY